MKVKDFIFWTPSKIKNLEPIRTSKNKYGATEYFYLINNANVCELKKPFLVDFKEGKEIDFEWYINRWAVAIVNKGYLMNKFLKKDSYELLTTWTNREITIN
jgi:hypothetical protein